MNVDGLDVEADQTSFARLVGVSQQAISGRVSDGRLEKGETLQQWLHVYLEDLREQASGRGGDEQANFQRARAREMEASSKLKEMQYHEKMGTLIHAEHARAFLSDWAQFARSEIDAAFDGFIAAVEDQIDEPLPAELREKYAGTALRRIRDFTGKLVGSSAGGGDSV